MKTKGKLETMQIKVIEGNKQYEISAKDTQTVLDAFREQGITSVAAPCNGQGKCKKCIFIRRMELKDMQLRVI